MASAGHVPSPSSWMLNLYDELPNVGANIVDRTKALAERVRNNAAATVVTSAARRALASFPSASWAHVSTTPDNGTDNTGVSFVIGDNNNISSDQMVLQNRDLLECIMTHLSSDDLVRTAAGVCRDWREVALHSPTIWQPRIDSALLQLAHQLQAASSAHTTGEGGCASVTVSPAQLHLAACCRNFLRNPAFQLHEQREAAYLNPLSKVSSPWVVREGEVEWGTISPSSVSSSAVAPAPSAAAAAAAAAAPSVHLPGAAISPPAPTATAPAPPAPLPYPSGNSRSSGSAILSSVVDAFQRMTRALVDGRLGGEGTAMTMTMTAASGTEAPVHGLPAPQQGQEPDVARPQGAQALPEQATQEAIGYIATENMWSEVVQVVDLAAELQRRGLTAAQAAQLLDSGLPLGLSVWVASSPGHRGQYGMALLLDDGTGPAPNMQGFVQRPGSYHYYSGRQSLLAPEDGSWQRFSHVVPACPTGARRAVVLLRGREAELRGTGFTGCRFASPSLAFVPQQQLGVLTPQ